MKIGDSSIAPSFRSRPGMLSGPELAIIISGIFGQVYLNFFSRVCSFNHSTSEHVKIMHIDSNYSLLQHFECDKDSDGV